jgi:hypothetical protein
LSFEPRCRASSRGWREAWCTGALRCLTGRSLLLVPHAPYGQTQQSNHAIPHLKYSCAAQVNTGQARRWRTTGMSRSGARRRRGWRHPPARARTGTRGTARERCALVLFVYGVSDCCIYAQQEYSMLKYPGRHRPAPPALHRVGPGSRGRVGAPVAHRRSSPATRRITSAGAAAAASSPPSRCVCAGLLRYV